MTGHMLMCSPFQMLKDVAYNVRENVMYTLLHTGEILIFNANTNPCSATQLWVPSHAAENVTCISMVSLFSYAWYIANSCMKSYTTVLFLNTL